jgi:hypothetical protein
MLYFCILGVGILQHDLQMPGISAPHFLGERFHQQLQILGARKNRKQQGS